MDQIGAMKKTNNRTLIGTRVTICKRGKKKIYQADFHWNGQHRRISLRTANKRVAIEKAIALEKQLIDGTYGSVESHEQSTLPQKTFEEATEEFLDYKLTEGLRPKTFSKYRGILKLFASFLATKSINKVGKVHLTHIDDFRKKRNSEIGTKSMHHEGTLLKAFFAWCHDRSYCRKNPLEKRKFSPPKAKKKQRVLTLAQINNLVYAASGNLRYILGMIAFTGMRSGECQRLLVQDIDLKSGWIHIRSRTGKETKTGDEWKVPTHPALRMLLEEYSPRKSGYYFTQPPSRQYPNGDHEINTKRLNESFQKLLRSQGLPTGIKNDGFTIHSLRHAFKSICVSRLIPREYVDHWQGHSSISNASDIYFHTFETDSQEHIRKVPFGQAEPAV